MRHVLPSLASGQRQLLGRAKRLGCRGNGNGSAGCTTFPFFPLFTRDAGVLKHDMPKRGRNIRRASSNRGLRGLVNHADERACVLPAGGVPAAAAGCRPRTDSGRVGPEQRAEIAGCRPRCPHRRRQCRHGRWLLAGRRAHQEAPVPASRTGGFADTFVHPRGIGLIGHPRGLPRPHPSVSSAWLPGRGPRFCRPGERFGAEGGHVGQLSPDFFPSPPAAAGVPRRGGEG